MQTEKMLTAPAGLQTLSDRIEAWRSTRPRTRPMPEALWNEAVSMTRELGVFRVSRVLRLNFDTLKRTFDAIQDIAIGVRAEGPRVHRFCRREPISSK